MKNYPNAYKIIAPAEIDSYRGKTGHFLIQEYRRESQEQKWNDNLNKFRNVTYT